MHNAQLLKILKNLKRLLTVSNRTATQHPKTSSSSAKVMTAMHFTGQLKCYVTRQHPKKDRILRTDKNIHVRNKTLDQNEMLGYMTKCYVTRHSFFLNPLYSGHVRTFMCRTKP